ncbi:MAG: caspase family protein [Saprospiraceae bacterium]
MFLLSPLLAQNKKALIVAISNYPAEKGFKPIHSKNDVGIIKSALLHLGFQEKDIRVLQEENATKKNILNELEKNFLTELKAGDIAYFHFSGHGQQVQDRNSDELDGYDEALVPYNAIAQFKSGEYQGEQHLIDDELNKVYGNIRKKLGPNGHFLLTIDACHSGTSTRGLGSSRGIDVPIASKSYIQLMARKKIDQSPFDNSNSDESKMSSMVTFYGSRANQLNYEIQAEDGKYYGALSYAFSKAVINLSPQASYQQLFDKIKLIIEMHNNNQNPEASGILGQVILGGKTLETPNYFKVNEWQDSNNVVINGGFLNGITPGTIVGFYPAESRNRKIASPIQVGTVGASSSSSCSVQITEGLSKEASESSWVMIKEENFGNLILHLQLKSKFISQNTEIWKEITTLPYIKEVNASPDLVLLEEGEEILLSTKNEIIIAKFPMTSTRNDMVYLLKEAFTQFGQAQYLRKLIQENKDMTVEFEIILLARNGVRFSELNPAPKIKDANNNIKLKIGDEIKIKVSNVGTKPCYYSLLDIQPDNKTNVMFPKATDSPSDYFLNPGNSLIVPTSFRMDLPLGQELFKLIATKNPVNLRPLEQRRGRDIQKEKDPFEILINNSYYKNEETFSRGGPSTVPAGQVNIYSLSFKIEK